MTNTNPRDLIQRLADELDAETGYTIHSTGDRVTHSDVVEARAYLAQPEPQGPTDDELDELWDEEGSYFNLYPEVRRTIRAVLARWGS
jgi:hypothetical protein